MNQMLKLRKKVYILNDFSNKIAFLSQYVESLGHTIYFVDVFPEKTKNDVFVLVSNILSSLQSSEMAIIKEHKVDCVFFQNPDFDELEDVLEDINKKIDIPFYVLDKDSSKYSIDQNKFLNGERYNFIYDFLEAKQSLISEYETTFSAMSKYRDEKKIHKDNYDRVTNQYLKAVEIEQKVNKEILEKISLVLSDTHLINSDLLKLNSNYISSINSIRNHLERKNEKTRFLYKQYSKYILGFVRRGHSIIILTSLSLVLTFIFMYSRYSDLVIEFVRLGTSVDGMIVFILLLIHLLVFTFLIYLYILINRLKSRSLSEIEDISNLYKEILDDLNCSISVS